MLRGLLNGAIASVGSDHAPHLFEEKSQKYPLAPSGVPGVETTLPLFLNEVHKGTFSIEHVVNWLSTAPAHVEIIVVLTLSSE